MIIFVSGIFILVAVILIVLVFKLSSQVNERLNQMTPSLH